MGHIHHLPSTPLHLGSTFPWFSHIEGILMYYWGRRPSDFYHSWYYLPPHLVVVAWRHASEEFYNLLVPLRSTLWLFVIFYVVCPLIKQFQWCAPFYFWVDPCMMYPDNLSRRLGWYYLLILTLDLFGSRFYVLERSIYWDSLSFVKRFLVMRILNIRKFCRNSWKLCECIWMWLLHPFLRHFSGTCMQTNIFLW